MTKCPVHRIIKTQTFSVVEMEFLIHNAALYRICDSCIYVFVRRISEQVQNYLVPVLTYRANKYKECP